MTVTVQPAEGEPEDWAADIIIYYFDTHGINDARAGAFNIVDRLKEAGLAIVPALAQSSDGGVAGEPVESENTSVGGITWHSSDEDSGPDVGISVYLGHDDRLWCGEISRKTFDENNGGAHFDSDGGGWIVRYQGSESKLIAKCADDLEAREFIEQISIWLRALPPVPGNEGWQAITEECADIADRYDDCGGAFIAQKIRDRALSLPRSKCGTDK